LKKSPGIVGRTYFEDGKPVIILIQWKRTTTWINQKGNKVGGPKNVLIRRANGEEVVRSFRGLRKRPSEALDLGEEVRS
jgi:acetyl esterase